jgi:hypothetical protein
MKQILTRFNQLTYWQQAVVLLAIFGLAFGVYTLVSNELDRRKFERIDSSVVELRNRIETELGLETSEVERRCFKLSRKLEREPTYCESRFVVLSSDEDLIKTHLSSNENVNDFRDDLGSFTNNENGNCGLSDRRDLETFEIQSFEVSCGAEARISHYEFED